MMFDILNESPCKCFRVYGFFETFYFTQFTNDFTSDPLYYLNVGIFIKVVFNIIMLVIVANF